jgi:uncharacterized membrane protein YccC
MTRKAPFIPSFWDVVFSLKTFSAAMLACFIAMRFDLTRPYWAIMAVYVVSQPISGMTTSKAIYRLWGTVIGGFATIILVPNLIGSPELLTLGISLWIGICLFLSLLDRTPRFYMFRLAGYTAAVTGFALVSVPENSFDYVVARVEETAIGIICSALINRLVFPRPAGNAILTRIDAWLRDAVRLVQDCLEGQVRDSDTLKDRRTLAADVVELGNFMTHLSFDTSSMKDMTDRVRLLQWRMTRLLPLFSTLHDQIAALKLSNGELPADISKLADRIITWTKQRGAGERKTPVEDEIRELNAQIAALEHTHSGRSWNELLTVNFCRHLRRLLKLWGDCFSLREDVATGNPRHRLKGVQYARIANKARQHHDYGMIFLSVFAFMLSSIAVTAFWIATGWPAGAGAAILGTVFGCIAATLDNPVSMMRSFTMRVAIAIFVAAIYQFIIFPRVDGFLPLAAALGLYLIPVGTLMATPSGYIAGLTLCVNVPVALRLQSRLNPDFEMFINQNTAQLIGLAFTAVILGTVRSMGSETSARRLLHTGWNELKKLTTPGGSADTNTFIQRMFDRIALLAPRLASIPANSEVAASDIFRDMRIGLNVINLQAKKESLSSEHRDLLNELLTRLSAYYRSKCRRFTFRKGPDRSSLLILLDQTLMAISESGSPAIIQALVGLRNGLSGGRYPFPYSSLPNGSPSA